MAGRKRSCRPAAMASKKVDFLLEGEGTSPCGEGTEGPAEPFVGGPQGVYPIEIRRCGRDKKQCDNNDGSDEAGEALFPGRCDLVLSARS